MNFIHFGCWNNGHCSKNGENDLSRVMSALRKEQPDFITVCGDNYYPVKIKDKKNKTEKKKDETKKEKTEKKGYKKTKQLIIEDLKAGFGCLPKTVPIHMVFGNHDYETGLLLNGVEEEKNACTITKTELELGATHKNVDLHFFKTFSPHPSTLIVMFDTTIYDEDGLDKYVSCYSALDTEYTSVNIIRESQETMLKNALSEYSPQHQIKNVVIVGHHPIINYKCKDDKLKEMRLSDEFENLLYDHIYAKFGEKVKYTYLCADLHQYQRGTIMLREKMTIHQHIVGTGGADKDPYLMTDTVEDITREGITYHMSTSDRYISGMKNGYLKCNLGEKDTLNCVFHDVIHSTIVKQGRKTFSTGRRSKSQTRTRRRHTI